MTLKLSRSPKNPRIAYVILPPEVVDRDCTAAVYRDGQGRIGIKFTGDSGEFVVRKCSSRAYRRRVNLPKQMVDDVPFGLKDHPINWVGDLLVIDPRA